MAYEPHATAATHADCSLSGGDRVIRTASNSKNKPSTSSCVRYESHQQSEGTATLQNAEIGTGVLKLSSNLPLFSSFFLNLLSASPSYVLNLSLMSPAPKPIFARRRRCGRRERGCGCRRSLPAGLRANAQRYARTGLLPQIWAARGPKSSASCQLASSNTLGAATRRRGETCRRARFIAGPA